MNWTFARAAREGTMPEPSNFNPRERLWLGVLAVAGLVGLNGVFVYSALYHRETVLAALRNPVALAFIVEAFVVMGLVAWLLGRWQRNRLGWGWFVLLTLIGGLAFGIPAVLLIHDSDAGRGR
jgi:hypothetical protein